jgi:hypothetical protein
MGEKTDRIERYIQRGGGGSKPQQTSPDDRPSRWGILRAALIAAAAAELKGFVEELLPGFQEEYRKAEASQRSF